MVPVKHKPIKGKENKSKILNLSQTKQGISVYKDMITATFRSVWKLRVWTISCGGPFSFSPSPSAFEPFSKFVDLLLYQKDHTHTSLSLLCLHFSEKTRRDIAYCYASILTPFPQASYLLQLRNTCQYVGGLWPDHRIRRIKNHKTNECSTPTCIIAYFDRFN